MRNRVDWKMKKFPPHNQVSRFDKSYRNPHDLLHKLTLDYLIIFFISFVNR